MNSMTETFESNDVMSVSADRQITSAVSVKGLSLAFGGQNILDSASFSLKKGEVVLLRGGNGSGKTTLLNILSGFIRPDSGEVYLNVNGTALNPISSSPEAVARAGLGRLWQDIRLFPTMTVLENVMAATQGLAGQNPFMSLVSWSRVRSEEKQARNQAIANLEIVGMADRASSSADMLSVGQMKRVALARLLQAKADTWLLDEPLAGLDFDSVASFLGLLKTLNADHKKTFLIVEHQHEKVMPVCTTVWDLKGGKIIAGKEVA